MHAICLSVSCYVKHRDSHYFIDRFPLKRSKCFAVTRISLFTFSSLHTTQNFKTNSSKNILSFFKWDGEGFHCYLEPQIVLSRPQRKNMLCLAFLSLSNIVTLLKSLYVLFKSQLECVGHTNAPVISFQEKPVMKKNYDRSQRAVKTHQCLEPFKQYI